MTFQEAIPFLLAGKTIERSQKEPTQCHGYMPRYLKLCDWFNDDLAAYQELDWDWLTWDRTDLTKEDLLAIDWKVSEVEPEYRDDLYSK